MSQSESMIKRAVTTNGASWNYCEARRPMEATAQPKHYEPPPTTHTPPDTSNLFTELSDQ